MRIYEPDRSLRRAFICDIDGTLSDHGGLRGHFEYKKVSTDRPIWHVIHMVEALYESKNWVPILMSGREDYCAQDTYDWMAAYLAVPITHMFMRKTGDYRKDAIIKEEIFWEHIAPNFWVEFAIDDRNQVVQMWRSIGLPCFQVADGAF